MKYIVYVNDPNIAEKIKAIISEILPSAKGDIVNTCVECFTKGGTYDYAFISDNNEGIPWMHLMFHLAAQGVGVYFIAEVIDKDLLKNIKEASGLAAINVHNLEQEIKSIFEGFEDKSVSDTEEIEDQEFKRGDVSFSLKSIQDYALLKSRKYPAVIISVHGAKGGVGKTSIAVNTAVMLAKMGLKTIAVDLDIENGNLNNLLQINLEKDLKDIIRANFSFTETYFEQHSSGLFVLPGLKIPAESELITGEIAEKIIGRLARIFDVIVIDTGSLEIDPMLVAMQLSTRAYFITTYDLTVIAKTYDLLEDAKMMGVDIDKIQIVVNRVHKRVGIKRSDISNYLNKSVLVEIPEDEWVLNAINNARIPVETRRCEQYTKGIKVIVDDIIKATELINKVSEKRTETPRKKGLFRK